MRAASRAVLPHLLAACLLAGGCLDHAFCTLAAYEAPHTGCRVFVFSEGIVKAGRDLSEGSDGSALICSTAGASRKDVKLAITHMEKARYEISGGSKGVLAWTWNDFPETLNRLFDKAGYQARDEAELMEIGRVMNGVMSGPKGTVLKGQTTILNVLEVDYRYGKCTSEMSGRAGKALLSCSP
jgi:hypothetical protein